MAAPGAGANEAALTPGRSNSSLCPESPDFGMLGPSPGSASSAASVGQALASQEAAAQQVVVAPHAPAAADVLVEQLLCQGCQLPCTPEDSKPRSSRSQARFHLVCANAYKLHQKRWSKEPALKRAWQDKTPEQLVEWYCKRFAEGKGTKGQKRHYIHGGGRGDG